MDGNFKVACKTDVGGRKNNEDYCGWKIVDNHLVGAVADGMGGMEKGEGASKTAVESLLNFLSENLAKYGDYNQLLEDAFQHANRKVAEALEGAKGGTTLVAFIYTPEGKLYLANVGDSRAYLIEDGEVKLLTRDHSLAWAHLEEEGLPREEIARKVREVHYRNLLTRALGTDSEVAIDTLTKTVGTEFLKPSKGSLLLLLTDGVRELLDEELLKELSSNVSTLEELVERLVGEALKREATDNLTALAVQF